MEDSTAALMEDSTAAHMEDTTAAHMEAVQVEEVIPEASLPRFYVVAHEARPNLSATCMSSTDQSTLLAVVKEENADLPSVNNSAILFEFEPCKKEELNEEELLEYPTAVGEAAAQLTTPECLATSVGQGQTSTLDAPECLATSGLATATGVLPTGCSAGVQTADGSSADASQSSNIEGQATVSSVVPSCFRSMASLEGFPHLEELGGFGNVETHKGSITLSTCPEIPQCQLIPDHPLLLETSGSSPANTIPPTPSRPDPAQVQTSSVNCLALSSAVNTGPATASLGPPPAQPELSNKEAIQAAAKGSEGVMVAPAVLKRKRKKKVTKKDFKSIVDKVVCQLPYMSVSGESQHLSQLLSDEDFEKIAIKVEQDFYTGPNDSVFIPFILDTDEASSDVEITFSNIKEPRYKKRRTITKEKPQKHDQSSSNKTPKPVKKKTATHQAQLPPSLLTTKPPHPGVDTRQMTGTTEKLTHPPNTHSDLASTSIPRHLVSLLKESIRKRDVLINLPAQQHSPTPSPILPQTQRGSRPVPHVSSMSSLLATRSSTPLSAQPCAHPTSTSLTQHSPALTATTKNLSEDYVSGEELFSDEEDNGGSTKQLAMPPQKFQNCMSPSNSNWILMTQPISSSPRKLMRLNQVLKSPEPQHTTQAPYQSPALTEQSKTEKKTVSLHPRVPSTKGQVDSACSSSLKDSSTSSVSHTVPAASASHTGAHNSSLDASHSTCNSPANVVASHTGAHNSACNSPASVVDVIADLLVQHLKPKARHKVSSDIQTMKANTSGHLGAQRTCTSRVNASISPMNDTQSSDSFHLSVHDSDKTTCRPASDRPTCTPASAGNKLSPHTPPTNKKTKKVDKDGRKKKDPLRIKLAFLSRTSQLNKTSSLDKTPPLDKTPALDKTPPLDTFNSAKRTSKMSPLASDLSVKMIKTTSPLVSNLSVKGTKKTPATQSQITAEKNPSNRIGRQADEGVNVYRKTEFPNQKVVPECTQPSSITLPRKEVEPATFNLNKKHMSANTGQSPKSYTKVASGQSLTSSTKVASGQSLTSSTKVASGQSLTSSSKVASDLQSLPLSPSQVNDSSVKTTKASHTTSNTNLETSEHLQDFRSPKKTIRGLASKNSPIILSSTWVDKSHVDVGESWISSPVNRSSSSPHHTQPTVATHLRGAALDSPDLILLDSPDLVILETSKVLHQSSNSSSSRTSSCKKILFSTSNSLNRNSSKCKGIRSASFDETLPSPKKPEDTSGKALAAKSNVTLGLARCTSETDECKKTETFTKVPAKAVIIAESPLPLRQRLGLTNPFVNNNPGQCQQVKQAEGLKQVKQAEGLKQVKQQPEGLKQAEGLKQQAEGLKQVKQQTEGLKQVKQTEGLKQVKQQTKALKQVQAPATSVSDQPTEEVNDELDTTFDDICLQEIEALEQQYQQTVQPSAIPCAKTPAQHKRLKKVSKTKTSKAPSPFTPMAPYDEMATPELKKAVSKIGVRPVCKKRMRDLLKQVYHATHQYETDSEYEGTPVKCMRTNVGPSRLQLDVPQKSKPKTTVLKNQQKAKTGSVNCLPATHSVADSGLPRAAVHNSSSSEREEGSCQDEEDRGSQDSSYSDSPDLPEESILQGWPDEEIGSTQLTQTSSEVTQERLVQFVMENKDVYEKVLMYEPLELDVLKKRIAEAGIRTSMEKVMDFLDERCITFTMKNINKGHNRHQRKQKNKSSRSPKKSKSLTNKE
ncbi:uro-adherence factor A-like isoform X2 [Physella acuta]|uniref:uro-adherence factor A-like isoform X2 n=1 Tax=Physella acuta TaxID=109671 RepID=UPI0027DC6A86|nr:uro-adherence factor A-like isoform X2 [Physella acuta]